MKGTKESQDNLSLYLQHLNSPHVSVNEIFSKTFVIKEWDRRVSMSSLVIGKQGAKVTFMMNLL